MLSCAIHNFCLVPGHSIYTEPLKDTPFIMLKSCIICFFLSHVVVYCDCGNTYFSQPLFTRNNQNAWLLKQKYICNSATAAVTSGGWKSRKVNCGNMKIWKKIWLAFIINTQSATTPISGSTVQEKVHEIACTLNTEFSASVGCLDIFKRIHGIF